MGFYDEIPLFLNTNLGTHFMSSVSHDITAGDLKDSMAVKHVFEGASKTRLLHLDLSYAQNPLNIRSPLSNSSPYDNDNQSQKSVILNADEYKGSSPIVKEQSETSFSSSFRRKNEKKKKKIIEHHDLIEEVNICAENREEVKSTFGPNLNDNEQEFCKSVLENSSKNTEAISVTGIISRFFTDFDEVDSCYCQPKHPREIELMHENNLIESMTKASITQPQYINHREIVESDEDAMCSSAKEGDESMEKRSKTHLKAKNGPGRSRKSVGRQSSISYFKTSSRNSLKHRVGKRLVEAANGIQSTGSRQRSGSMFLSVCRNRIGTDSGLLVNRRIDFDEDDFVV